MYDKKTMDNMTQRYKDEMMKIYRQQQVKCNNTPPATVKPPEPEKKAEETIIATEEVTPAKTVVIVSTEPDGPFHYSEFPLDKDEKSFITEPIKECVCEEKDTAVQQTSTPKFRTAQDLLNEMTQAMEEETTAEEAVDMPQQSVLEVPIIEEPKPILDEGIMNVEAPLTSEIDEFPTPPDIEIPAEVQEMLDMEEQSEDTPLPVTDNGEIIFDPTVINTADADYDETAPNTGTGFLQVETFVADKAIPIEGASVVITRKYKDGDVLIGSLTTNQSGKTPTINLPAPPKIYSEELDNTTVQPYSEYIIEVKADGFYPEENFVVPVFDSIKSIQPFQLVPLPKNTPPQTSSSMS